MKAKDQDGRWHRVLIDAEDEIRLRRYTWRIDRDGYVYRQTSRRVPGKAYPKGEKRWLHREVLGLPPIRFDPRRVNHDNRNKLDNRRRNLIPMTHKKNMQHWMDHDRNNGLGRWAAV